MLTTIKGIYEAGTIVLSEELPIRTKTDVIITFLDEERSLSNNVIRLGGMEGKIMVYDTKSKEKLPQQRKLGGLKGKVHLPDDFNEPLDDLHDYMF